MTGHEAQTAIAHADEDEQGGHALPIDMHRTIRTSTTVGVVAALAVGALISPAAAQYAGNERGFVVSPLRVPAGGDLSGVGFGCSAAGTVTITILGEPGTLTTVIAEDDSTYAFGAVAIPSTLDIGATYSAVASCDGGFETAAFTVICANGDEPDADGSCPSPTTTTVAPTSADPPTTTIDRAAGGISDPLAFTGASTLKLIQLAVTLTAVGVLFVLLGRRRDREDKPAPAT